MGNIEKSVIKITGLHHSGVLVNDLDRAVEFYTGVLGMTLSFIRKADTRIHFTGTNLPEGLDHENPQGEKDYYEFLEDYAKAKPGKKPLVRFASLKAGDSEVVLFERPEPVETETLIENSIFHQSYHISSEDMEHLIGLKAQGNSGIAFHTGPVLRWPFGRAIYVWDGEGNYIELECDEDLPAQFGIDLRTTA